MFAIFMCLVLVICTLAIEVIVGRGLGPGSGRVEWCYVCVCCESGFFG